MQLKTRLSLILLLSLIFHYSAYADLSDGLIAHYPFDGNANDISENNLHGIEIGGVSYAPGIINLAASFDGVNDYINFGNNFNINIEDVYSFSLFFNTNEIPSDTFQGFVLINKRAADNGYFDADGHWQPGEEEEGYAIGTHFYEITPYGLYWNYDIFNQGEWNHLAVIIDRPNNVIKYYMNGWELAAEPIDSINDFSNPNDFLVGAGYLDDPNSHEFFLGQIDDIRIYNRVLTPDEINTLANTESPTPTPDPAFLGALFHLLLL